MQFSQASIQSVKSISQRALYLYWKRLAADRPFPTLKEFDPGSRVHDPKQLVIWNIEDVDRQRCFRALYQGNNVTEVFNSSWAGKTMDEVVPAPLKSFTMDAANECAASGCAIYTVLATRDANEQQVDCERLLLPLGERATVKQMVASLQLISLKGEFARKNVLSQFENQSQIIFAGRIRSGPVMPETELIAPTGDVSVVAEATQN